MSHALQQIVENAPLLLIGLRATLMLAAVTLAASTVIGVVLGTLAASASYIAAPPAARMTLPEANPTYYLTASLAITFPFNLVVGIPLFYSIARLLSQGGGN